MSPESDTPPPPEAELLPPEARHWFEQRGIVTHLELRDARGGPLSPELAAEVQAYVTRHKERQALLQKLSVLGEVSASMAHEVRNVITGILGLSQLKTQGGSEERVHLIRTEAERCGQLLSNFLSFACAPESPVALLSARDIFDPVCLMLVAEAKLRRCRLITSIDATAPAFRARAPELRQVLLNLALNALQAVPEGGTVELLASSYASGVCLSVVDNGKGIDAHLLERIFEPFVTTKVTSGGTGLGLSTSRQLVEAMGGVIRAGNRAGGGACFEVLLPVDEGPLQPTPGPRD